MPKKTINISVILAAYQGENLIAEQLRSLFAQTRTPDEILIGDDSPDELTFEAVESVRGECPSSCELIYCKNPERLGFLKNFSSLAERARGNILFFCDQDDWWFPGKIESLVSELERNPGLLLVFCNGQYADKNLHPQAQTLFASYEITPDRLNKFNHGDAFSFLLLESDCVTGHNMAIRRELRPLLSLCPEYLRFHDQWLALCAAFYGQIRGLDQVLTLTRRHEHNITSFHEEKNIQRRNRPLTLHRILECLKENRVYEEILLPEKNYHQLRKSLLAFQPSPPPPENLQFLNELIQFIEQRSDFHRHPVWSRLFFLSSVLYHGYFRFASGFRSLLRDLITPRIKSDH